MKKIEVEKDSVEESYRWAYGWRVVDGKCSPPAKNFPRNDTDNALAFSEVIEVPKTKDFEKELNINWKI